MKDIIDFLEGYGFYLDFKDKQNKLRYRNEDTFIDIWSGKKGITVGLYNPTTKSMKFNRRINLETLERLITQ